MNQSQLEKPRNRENLANKWYPKGDLADQPHVSFILTDCAGGGEGGGATVPDLANPAAYKLTQTAFAP